MQTNSHYIEKLEEQIYLVLKKFIIFIACRYFLEFDNYNLFSDIHKK